MRCHKVQVCAQRICLTEGVQTVKLGTNCEHTERRFEQPNDPALNRRCICIAMFESKTTALLKGEERQVQEMAAEFQAQLFQFRFDRY